MKHVILLLVIGAALCTRAQVAHDWTATLKVVDDDGKPLAGAKAGIANSMGKLDLSGLTGTNGMFVASHHDAIEGIVVYAEKTGYYPFRTIYHRRRKYTPESWNSTHVVVLRKVMNPIPMYAKQQRLEFPKEGEPLGFDLMVGDWVAPFGKGIRSDLLLAVRRKIISDREFTGDLAVTFPSKGDGIAAAPTEEHAGSAFKTSRNAAESGYEQELDLHYSDKEQPQPVFGYFIRIRTALDQDGRVKSALYGKIAGNFHFYAGTIAPKAGVGFDYYLNPTPNDRNLEFDPRRNLLGNLKSIEQIKEP